MQPFNRPIVCPVLIGRAPHVEALESCLREALAQRGQTLLVSGEAGIGKSRLVAEARERAGAQGMVVVTGRCFESQQSLPYAPMIDLLRTAAETRGAPLRNLLGATLGELGWILPELSSPGEQPAFEQHRLVHALVESVRMLAGGGPALVVIEDAHWADEASLAFMEDLARRIEGTPVLLLITYREDEVSTPLSRLLAALDRQRLASELRLGALTQADVAEMMRTMLEQVRPIGPELIESIYALTEGNPFFVEEVLRSLIAAGDIDVSSPEGAWIRRPIGQLRIPRSVRDAVERRAERLNESSRHVLALAAVAGQELDLTLLQTLAGVDEPAMLRAIKELTAAGLVVEESAERFTFRHALTRETVQAGLLARERQFLHRAIAEAMESLHGSSPEHLEAQAAGLARHSNEAQDWGRVLKYAPLAGRRALALWSHGAAVECFVQGLEAARQLGLQPPLDLLRDRALAHDSLGNFDAARADFETTLELAREAGDRHAEWRALVDLGGAWVGLNYSRGGEYYRAALELGRQLEPTDPSLLARTLNCLGNWHANLEQPSQSLQFHNEALAIFERAGDQRGVAETLDLLGMASLLQGDHIAAARFYERSVPLLRALDHRQALVSSLATLAIATAGGHLADLVAMPNAPPERPRRDAETALAIARESGWRAGEVYALNAIANCCLGCGAYGRLLDVAGESLRIAESIGHGEWVAYCQSVFGTAYVEMAMPDIARDYYERAMRVAEETESLYWTRSIRALSAIAWIELGEPDHAAKWLEGFVDEHRPAETWAERGLHYARALVYLAVGDPRSALRVVDGLIATDPNPGAGAPIPRLSYLRGAILHGLGQLSEAEEALLAAGRAAHRHGLRPLLWRIEAQRRRVLARQGRRAEADAVAATARGIISELAGEIPDASLRTRFLERAGAQLPSTRELTPLQAAKYAFGGLSAREREVAVLIGQGKSNREIAEALVLGERTVHSHVSHILQKLDFSTRAQIAAWVAGQMMDGSS